MEEPFASWSEFNVAVAGAGAALGGLLIVALSVNITTIAESRGLAARAGASIAGLILGVALSCAALIPGQGAVGYGIQVLIGTALCAVVVVRSALAVQRDAAQTGFRRYTAERVALFAIPPAIYAVAGVVLVLAPALPLGLILVAVGTILAIVTTVLFSWVALVEVLR
ncbi:hypothetical protein [Leifsonia sp. 21MFCrub1.1]|uniref:hypothetical protein n=1 Tax=Leifsonia sp. 21MFCrub1.1 TaxID=1798223 RepID=UPI0008928EE1|nr:hypothetical protein [Leifsonia sp. 21MFCrub1.1]SEB13305.1 hypothetical protein SAMN04515680_3559 [Leifsonia sp. 21MFCrub1.1]